MLVSRLTLPRLPRPRPPRPHARARAHRAQFDSSVIIFLSSPSPPCPVTRDSPRPAARVPRWCRSPAISSRVRSPGLGRAAAALARSSGAALAGPPHATPCRPATPSPGPHAPPPPHAASWAAREEQTRSRPRTSPTSSPCSPHASRPRARSAPPPQPARLRPPPHRSRWGASEARRSSYLCQGIRSTGLAALVDALVAGGRCDVHVCAPESDKLACGHSITIRETITATSVDFTVAKAFEI